MTNKVRYFWLTRCTLTAGGWYYFWAGNGKPWIDDLGDWLRLRGRPAVDCFCPVIWRQTTGLCLKCGQIVRIRRTVLKNGFKFEVVK